MITVTCKLHTGIVMKSKIDYVLLWQFVSDKEHVMLKHDIYIDRFCILFK